MSVFCGVVVCMWCKCIVWCIVSVFYGVVVCMWCKCIVW